MIAPPPSSRFFLLSGLALLALGAGYAAVVLSTATGQEAQQLDQIFPFYNWHIRPFTATAYESLRHTFALLALLLTGVFIGLARARRSRPELAALGRELWLASGGLATGLLNLTRPQRRVALVALALLTGLRLSLSIFNAEYDDAASYTFFVSRGLLAVSAYYPVPNNHVLSNTLSWLFYQVYPGFWWTMRLPVLLAATATSGLLLAGLLRERVSFRPALLAVVLFSVAQLSLYHAAVGRGYWLLTGLAAITFFCTLALSSGTSRPRAAWAGILVTGGLGAYTVPTFALVLASAFSWLGLHYWRRRDWPGLVCLSATGGLIVASALLLYAPLLFISGPGMFFGNGFVSSHPMVEFAATLPRFLWETEGFLAGQIKIGALLTIAGLSAALFLLRQTRRGQLPAALAAPWERLAPAALWFAGLPYAIIVLQRVYAPGRTLMYKAFFFYLLLALVVEWLLQIQPGSRLQRGLRPALGAVALLWGAYQVNCIVRDNRRPGQHNADFHAAFAWLADQPRGRVLVPDPTHNVFLNLYFRAERPDQRWQLAGRPQPGTYYAYVVAFPDHRGYFQPHFTYPPAYHNREVDIYRVPATAPVPVGLPAYWHLAD